MTARETRKLVLDTSAYSHFRRGHQETLHRITHAELVCVPTVVIGELEAGFVGGSRYRENHQSLSEFLSEGFVSILPVTDSVARRYGQLFGALKRAGTPIPTNDIWIAAATLEHAGHLITFDADYRAILGLEHTLLS